MFSRTERVIGAENLQKIIGQNIAVLGVGGVGGYVAEMLCRLGIGKITIVDFDKIDVSNINRQIIATNSTVGKYKTEAFLDRIKDINPNCQVDAKNTKINAENIGQILNEKYDYVIDCIDDIKAKIEIVKYCKSKNYNLICSMGTGNRYKLPHFEVADISKTSYDKLAKKMRKLLKDEGIYNLDVVFTKEQPESTVELGSVVQYPLMCAGTIVGYIIKKILSK